MSKHYDIVERLQNANTRPKIKVTDELEFTVNTSKTNVILMAAIERDDKLSDGEKMDKIIQKMLGKDAFEKIEKMDLSMEATTLIVESIGAAISGETLEEIQERFQGK